MGSLKCVNSLTSATADLNGASGASGGAWKLLKDMRWKDEHRQLNNKIPPEN